LGRSDEVWSTVCIWYTYKCVKQGWVAKLIDASDALNRKETMMPATLLNKRTVMGFVTTFAMYAVSQIAVFATNQPVVVANTTANPVPTMVNNTVSNPVPAKITNTTLPTVASDNPAFQPFQASIYVSIANGSNSGGDNGNVSPGTQTVLIPAGKRLVVQTVSMYRQGTIATQTVQIFINSSFGGTYTAFALPVVGGTTASYVGAAQPMTFYADGGTELLANVFRSGTTGAESETVTISGYLVNLPTAPTAAQPKTP
jgi:hypothetical protein